MFILSTEEISHWCMCIRQTDRSPLLVCASCWAAIVLLLWELGNTDSERLFGGIIVGFKEKQAGTGRELGRVLEDEWIYWRGLKWTLCYKSNQDAKRVRCAKACLLLMTIYVFLINDCEGSQCMRVCVFDWMYGVCTCRQHRNDRHTHTDHAVVKTGTASVFKVYHIVVLKLLSEDLQLSISCHTFALKDNPADIA